jgi:hypothetical protein
MTAEALVERVANLIHNEEGEIYWASERATKYDYAALARAIIPIVIAEAETAARDAVVHAIRAGDGCPRRDLCNSEFRQEATRANRAEDRFLAAEAETVRLKDALESIAAFAHGFSGPCETIRDTARAALKGNPDD